MQRIKNPKNNGQQEKQVQQKQPRGQGKREQTSSSSPAYPSQDNSSKASPVKNISKKLSYDLGTPDQDHHQDHQSLSFQGTHFSSLSSSSSSSETSDTSEELEVANLVDSAIDTLKRSIPNLNPEFEKLSAEFSNLRFKIDDEKTSLYPVQFTVDEQAFLNSGISQFKKKIQAFNQDANNHIDNLITEKSKMNAAKKTFNDFLDQYKKHWEQNEKNRIELIEIKKAVARAYHQAAEQYLREEVHQGKQDDVAYIVSPTQAVVSPDSSPKKNAALNVATLVATSLVQSLAKNMGNEEARKASYVEKFNPYDSVSPYPTEDNFPVQMALGFSGNQLSVLPDAFENQVSRCTFIEIQNRINYLLSHFKGSRVHAILREKLAAQKILSKHIRVEYDENKKLGVFVWHDDCLRKDKQLIEDDEKISSADSQNSHIDEIQKQFQAQHPQAHALLESMKQANVALGQETARKPLKAEEIANNPVLSSVNQARIALKKLKETQAALRKDLADKAILYQRYINIPKFILELQKKEAELEKLEQALAKAKPMHDKKMQDLAVEIKMVSAVLKEEEDEKKIVRDKKPAVSGEESAQQAIESKGLPAQANRTTNHSAGELSGSSEGLSHSNSAGVEAQAGVNPSQAVFQIKSKSQEIGEDYQRIKENVLKNPGSGFDDQEKRIDLLLKTYDIEIERAELKISDQQNEQDSRQEKERQIEAQLTGKKDDLLGHLQEKLTRLKGMKLEAGASADEKTLHGEIQTYQLPDNLRGQAWAAARKTLKEFQDRRNAIDAAKRNAKQASDSVVGVVSNGSSKSLAVSAPSLPPPVLPKQMKQPKTRQIKKAESSKNNSARATFPRAAGEPSNLILFSFWIIGVWFLSVVQSLFQRQDNRNQFGLSLDDTPAATVHPDANKPSPAPSPHGSLKGKNHRVKQPTKGQNKVSGDSHAKLSQQLQQSSVSEGQVPAPSEAIATIPAPSLEVKKPAQTQGFAASKQLDWATTKNAALRNKTNPVFSRFCMLLFNFAGNEPVGFGIKAEKGKPTCYQKYRH